MMKKLSKFGLLIISATLAFSSCSSVDPKDGEQEATDNLTVETTSVVSEVVTENSTDQTDVAIETEESISVGQEECNHVNAVLHAVCQEESYKELSIDERYELYMEVLNQLATEGDDTYNYPLINKDSISYNESEESIVFQYRNGWWGSVDLGDWIFDYMLEE